MPKKVSFAKRLAMFLAAVYWTEGQAANADTSEAELLAQLSMVEDMDEFTHTLKAELADIDSLDSLVPRLEKVVHGVEEEEATTIISACISLFEYFGRFDTNEVSALLNMAVILGVYPEPVVLSLMKVAQRNPAINIIEDEDTIEDDEPSDVVLS